MNNLLLFFALPIATIILASVLETILHSPIKVASIAFAIYLIVTFAAFDETFLIYAIAYTILAYISAIIVKFILRLIHCNSDSNNDTIEVTSATVNAENATINAENVEVVEEGSNNSNNGNCMRGYNRIRRF